MDPEASLLCSQGSAISSYPKPDESSAHPTTLFLKINFNIISKTKPRSSVWSLEHDTYFIIVCI
jgi:hypothetical protein